jgi:hypothetical protein
MYRSFISSRKDCPNERLQPWRSSTTPGRCHPGVTGTEEKETIVGWPPTASRQPLRRKWPFAVRDDQQNRGIGLDHLSYLTYLSQAPGSLGITPPSWGERADAHDFERAASRSSGAAAAVIH